MKSYIGILGLIFFAMVPFGLSAQEDSQVVIPEQILEPGDPYVETSETTIQGESTADGSDFANVINPSEVANGKVQVKHDPEGYAEVYRSGALVERIPLVQTSDPNCLSALGQIGEVTICGSETTLKLLGRPEYRCPAGSNGMTEACAVAS